MRRIAALVLLLLGGVWVESADAACTGGPVTWTATPDYASVQGCLNNADDGDTVIVSAGTLVIGSANNSTTRLTIAGKGIKFRGDPSGQTIVQHCATAERMNLLVTEDTTHHVEIFDFTTTKAGCPSDPSFFITVQAGGARSKPVLIHDNDCTQPQCSRLALFFVDRGVVYKNTRLATTYAYNNQQFVRCGGAQKAYETLPTYGTADTTGTQHLYIEDNVVTGISETFDNTGWCRQVYRHNLLTSARVGGHGLDSGNGGRYHEVYGNIFALQTNPANGAINDHMQNWVGMRGSALRITQNVMPTIPGKPSNRAFISILANAYSDNIGGKSVPRWYSCWGNSLNPQHGTSGTNMFSGFQYPAPKQTGLGWDGGSTANNYTHNGISGYVMEGNYAWANTGTAADRNTITAQNAGQNTAMCANIGGTGVDGVAGYLQVGRDIFNGAAPTGYTPCDSGTTPANGTPTITGGAAAAGLGCNYPHPCRHDVQGTACGGSGTPPANATATISITSPAPFSNATSSTINVSGLASDDVAVVSVSWANKTTGGSGSASLGAGTWSVTGLPVDLGVNTVVFTVSDGILTNTATLQVRRTDCGSSLPYADPFTSTTDASVRLWKQLGRGWSPKGEDGPATRVVFGDSDAPAMKSEAG